MITIKKLILTISLLFTINLTAEEMAKVTHLRKGVQATVGNEIVVPKMGEEFPLTTKIECDKMGTLEFEYKGKIFRIPMNTTIFLWEVVKAGGGDERFKPDVQSSPTGARGLDKSKIKKTSRKRKSNSQTVPKEKISKKKEIKANKD